MFRPGWTPEIERVGLATSGRSLPRFRAAADGPPPPAYSLAQYVRYLWDQLPVGSCFANAAPQALMDLTAADNAAGASWDEPELSRAWIWYHGRRYDGLLGSAGDGGSVTSAFKALQDGCATEEDWPYLTPELRARRNDRSFQARAHAMLERTPPDAIAGNARRNRVVGVVEVSDDDEARRLIASGHPINDGTWWPFGWDSAVDGTGRATGIGDGQFGHSYLRIGYLRDWDGYDWWQFLNSHGPIYSPLPDSIAAAVPGYTRLAGANGKVYDFWARADWHTKVRRYGQYEGIAPVGLSGVRRGSWGTAR